jgi:hypothetical protein
MANDLGSTAPNPRPTGREASLANLRPPWQKGVSPNPTGRRAVGPSLKELAQNQPSEVRAAFVKHVLDSALASSSATAARWAQIFMEMSGDGGASFKLELEPGGKWAEIMQSLRAKLQIGEDGKPVVMIEAESRVVE